MPRVLAPRFPELDAGALEARVEQLLAALPQLQEPEQAAAAGRMRRGFCGGILGRLCRRLRRLRRPLRLAASVFEMLANFFGGSKIDASSSGSSFRDARFRQIVEDRLGLDLEFAGQFVDADLIGVRH